VFLHRPEYYHILQSADGLIDYHRRAEVIIAKHRKGATGIILMDFAGEFTRFENPEDNSIDNRAPTEGGEIRGSMVNGDGNNMPFPPPADYNPFNVDVSNDYRGDNT
jgi:replicative DNA helicase